MFTPNVLTETSNLLPYGITDPLKSDLAKKLAEIISKGTEAFIESKAVVKRGEYIRLGLTDAGLLEIANSGDTLLTDDLSLFLAATNIPGLKVVNYRHIQEGRTDFR